MPSSEILVRVARTSGAALPAGELDCSSRAAPWRDLLRLERGLKPPLGEAELTLLWPTIGVIRRDSGILEQRVAGEMLQALSLCAGAILTYPEGASVFARATRPIDSTCLQIAPTLLSAVARDLDRPARLVSTWRSADEQVERIAALLEAEVRAGFSGGRRYGEHLAHALANHVIRRYSEAAPPAAARLRKDKVAQAVEYLEANPIEALSLEKLARMVHLSPYHFARLFKQTTGLTPHQYVLESRIEEAKRLLRQGTLGLSEIAQRLGFRDQSHFTARFRQATGVTPKRWRDKHS